MHFTFELEKRLLITIFNSHGYNNVEHQIFNRWCLGLSLTSVSIKSPITTTYLPCNYYFLAFNGHTAQIEFKFHQVYCSKSDTFSTELIQQTAANASALTRFGFIVILGRHHNKGLISRRVETAVTELYVDELQFNFSKEEVENS